MWIADQWKDYAVLDCGGGEKVERWGNQVLVRPDPQLREETLKGYSYQVLLVPEAIGWGIGSGFILAFVVEGLLLLVGWVLLGGRRKPVKESWR